MLFLAMQSLPEKIGIQLTAGHNSLSLVLHQARAPQAEENMLIRAGVVADNLAQGLNQLFMIMQPEQIIAQMAAEGSLVVDGPAEEFLRAELFLGYQIQRQAG